MSKTNSQDHRKSVRDWLSMDTQWKIPVYQRHYAWDAKEDFGAPQLFFETVKSQATARLKKQRPTPHYFGAILVDEKKSDAAHKNYDVVDGQQRLTTLSVAMFALIGAAKKFGSVTEIKQELEKYVFLPPSHGESKVARTKVRPTNFDRDKFVELLKYAYRDSVSEQWEVRDQFEKSKVVLATMFFFEQFVDFIKTNCDGNEQDGINALRDAILDGFEFVLIELTDYDKAQKVFETMNTTGKPLTTFDIIRNSVFERAAEEEAGLDENLFGSQKWQALEDPFWEGNPGIREDSSTHIEMYIARMLMAKEGRYINLNRNSIVKAYKGKYGESGMMADVEKEIAEISTYVPIYKYLVGCLGSKNPVNDNFAFGWFMHSQCKNLDMASAIFVIIDGKQSAQEKQRMIRLLESYVVRRAVCGWTGANYNKQAPTICKDGLGKNPTYDKLHDYLHSLSGTAVVFPKNSDVEEGCVSHPIFKSKQKKYLNYIFNALVLKLADPRDEVTSIGKLTADHIIPQGWKETTWQKYLNDKKFSDDVVDSRLHTIGNLTPMSGKRNASKSNNPWVGENGNGAKDHLRHCNLTMTKNIGEKNTEWDIDDVTARSKDIAKTIFDVWPDDIKS